MDFDFINKAIAEGKTKYQFAVPDGEYVGDWFCITNSKNEIIIVLAWDGKKWRHNYETFNVENEEQNEQNKTKL